MKRLSDDPAVRLAECRGEVVPPTGVICDEVAPITEQAWRSLDSQPAGEVEVSNDACRQRFTTRIDQKMGGAMLGEVVVAEYHDAHVTRMTAENARLTAVLDDYKDGQERYEQLIEDLQSELTKARELLASIRSRLPVLPRENWWVHISIDEQLAHQSAPAAKGESCGQDAEAAKGERP